MDNHSPLPGCLKGVCDTPLQNPNARRLAVARRSAFLDIKKGVCDTPLQNPNAGRLAVAQRSTFLDMEKGVCDTPLQNPNAGRLAVAQRSASLNGVTMKNPSRMPYRQPASPASVGAYRIRPTGTRPSDNHSLLPGRFRVIREWLSKSFGILSIRQEMVIHSCLRYCTGRGVLVGIREG